MCCPDSKGNARISDDVGLKVKKENVCATKEKSFRTTKTQIWPGTGAKLPCEVMSPPSQKSLWEEEGILLRGRRLVSTKTNIP